MLRCLPVSAFGCPPVNMVSARMETMFALSPPIIYSLAEPRPDCRQQLYVSALQPISGVWREGRRGITLETV